MQVPSSQAELPPAGALAGEAGGTPPGRLGLALRMLKFDAPLEKTFQRERIEQTRLRLRTGGRFLVFVLLAYMGADIYRLHHVIGPDTWPVVAAILALRLLPMAPVIAGLMIVDKRDQRWNEDQLRRLAVTALALLGASTLAVLLLHYRLPQLSALPFSLNGLILVVLAYFFPTGLPLRTSLVLGLTLTLTTLVLMPLALPHQALSEYFVFAPYLVLTTIVAGLSAALHEVTQRRQFLLERQLRHAAERDALTALYNRGTFMLLIEQAAAAARRSNISLSLLLVDIDHFKAYNDQYGHPAGDAAIAAVAGVLARIGQRDPDLAARLGGEEFAVMLYDTPLTQAWRMAETFRLRVQDELALDHATSPTCPRLTVSIGVATLSGAMSVATLYKQADEALYVAKNSGRNKVSPAPPGQVLSTGASPQELCGIVPLA